MTHIHPRSASSVANVQIRGRGVRVVWAVAAAALFITPFGCHRVDLASLPAIPEVATETFLEGVQQQLDETFDAIRRKPGNRKLNGELAKMLQAYKQFESADVMYQRIRKLEPRKFEWAYLHGVVLEALGQPAESEAAFRDALTLNPSSAIGQVRLAKALVDQGKHDEARALYDGVLAKNPDLSEAHFAFAQLLIQQEEPDEAIEHLKKAIDLSGNFGAGHYQLGLAYRAKREVELAEHHFQLAELHRDYSADGSDPFLNSLLELNLSDQPFVNRAKMLAENGRLEEARKFNQMALDRNPDCVSAHANLMSLALTDGNFEAVDKHFQSAVALDPNNAKIYFNLGMARIASQRWDDAKNAFEKSLELDNKDPNTHVQLAILAKRAGAPLGAVEQSLRAALELDNRHQFANWLLGELTTASDPAAAAELLQQAVETEHPLLPLMYAALANARVGTGDWEAAEEALDAAVSAAKVANNAQLQQQVDSLRQSILERKAASALESGERAQ